MPIRSKGITEKGNWNWTSFYNSSAQKLNYADFFQRSVDFLARGVFPSKTQTEKTLKFYVVRPVYWREPTLEFRFQLLSEGSTTEQLADKERKPAAIARTLERLGIANITLKAGLGEGKIKELFDFLEKKEASLTLLKEKFPESVEICLKSEVSEGEVKNLRFPSAPKKSEIISLPVKAPESLRIEPLEEIKKKDIRVQKEYSVMNLMELLDECNSFSLGLWTNSFNKEDFFSLVDWLEERLKIDPGLSCVKWDYEEQRQSLLEMIKNKLDRFRQIPRR